MSEVIERLYNSLKLFEGMREFLRENGWYLSPPYSYRWWGNVETLDEVILTSILVQQTRWEAVSVALERMRRKGLNTFQGIVGAETDIISPELRWISFPLKKIEYMKNVSRFYLNSSKTPTEAELEAIKGIGKETARSILLFAHHKPVFPTGLQFRRAFTSYFGEDVSPNVLEILSQRLSTDELIYSVKLLYAGFVTVGKVFCKRSIKKSELCPLREKCLLNLSRP